MKKMSRLLLLLVLGLLIIAASEPEDPIRLTIINKSETDIAVQLNAVPRICCNKSDVDYGETYYLPVEEGSRKAPTTKTFIIERNTYRMQLFYIQTWDPVYGFECKGALPNAMNAMRNLRVVVLPCSQLPRPWAVGEPTMWKYLPFPVPELSVLFNRYWATRLIY